MTPERIVAALLALAVLVASVRWLLAMTRGATATRPRARRVVALLSLQAACAVLLYFTLLPPARLVDAGTMVVLTARADRVATTRRGEHVVALPEAGAAPGATRMPDLATALRRHPGTTRLRILGDGLTARDRDAVRGLALELTPPALPRGIVELWSPDRMQVGAVAGVRGRVVGVATGSAELLDPAGRRVDRRRLDKDGRFALFGEARSAGPFALRVRIRDSGGAVVEQASVPIHADAAVERRVLVLAGAPSPELKYLRRWATDAGLSLHTQIALGGGLRVGDPPIAFDPTTLKQFDLVVIDERAWQSLGAAQFDALRAAVRDGLGVLVRITGPLSAQGRARLRALGLTLASARVADNVRLDAPRPGIAPSDERSGEDTDDAAAIPGLTRRALRIDAIDGSPLLRDASGETLAIWRAEGRGRIAAWLLADSFRLVLAGHGERHARLWSDAAATLARTRGAPEPVLEGDALQGQRTVVCRIAAGSTVEAPDGARTPLLVDPGRGRAACAGFWPTVAGWHRVRSGDVAWPFHVAARDALPGVRARQSHEATAALASTSIATPGTATTPGPRWPWFLAWLAASALLWWLERARYGR